jgi:hypothetical protein
MVACLFMEMEPTNLISCYYMSTIKEQERRSGAANHKGAEFAEAGGAGAGAVQYNTKRNRDGQFNSSISRVVWSSGCALHFFRGGGGGAGSLTLIKELPKQ